MNRKPTQASFPSGAAAGTSRRMRSLCFSPPLIRGGQGRPASELIGSGWVVLACGVVLVLVILGSLME